MLLKGWVRLDSRTLVNHINGKLSQKERDDFRRHDGQKGAYDFFYDPETGRTTVRVTEHPEWTGEFAKKGERA